MTTREFVVFLQSIATPSTTEIEALGAIWTPDAKLLIGRRTFEGPEAIVAIIREAGSQSAPGAHAGYNVEISLAGSRADVKSD
jgi:hypothetical protein